MVVVRVVVVDVPYTSPVLPSFFPLRVGLWNPCRSDFHLFFCVVLGSKRLPAAGSTPSTDGVRRLSSGLGPSLVCLALIHHPSARAPTCPCFRFLSLWGWVFLFPLPFSLFFSRELSMFPFVDASSCRILERSLHNAISHITEQIYHFLICPPHIGYRSHVIVRPSFDYPLICSTLPRDLLLSIFCLRIVAICCLHLL